ncbi:SGNH/GDSL hydrolase family protein [Nonomuraea sp. K274]|uniref:SGNH/GDSL hydrolase family protein n=1 Tax=Nonomuraea cypriaca TaxID=1187855 RepID=A0A931F3N2_9ACTN|nr:SGNH/GDSL hydrolase family protein [Nonomuraea cypriaca]MBF8189983.1 SGNH/GDSL hydrolase family protein [Nonomuraea cypriaca]
MIVVMALLTGGCDGGIRGAPTPALARPAPPVMMFLGDSYTVGSGPVRSWQTYASETARLMGSQPIIAGAGGTGYVNEGRVGRTFRRSFEVQLAWRPAPDLLVISGGHNDRRWSTRRVRQAATTLLREVRGHWPATRIVMVGPIWLNGAPPKGYRVRDVLAEVAGAAGVRFLDPLRRRWVTGEPSEVLLPDGVHPTLAGHERLAAWLAAELS